MHQKLLKTSFGIHLKTKVQDFCGIDERTLALFRIMIALTVIVDLSSFTSVFSLFLTDGGICPRSCAATHSRSSFFLSLYYLNGSYFYNATLLFVTLIAALCLMVGYHTRVAVIICWILITSLNARITFSWYLADTLLALLLFWSMFLPLGACYSVDNALARHRIPPQRNNRIFVSVATLAIILQHAYIYTMGALLKSGSWLDGSAVKSAINLLQYRSSLSFLLEKSPALLEMLTVFVYYLELLTLPLLFFPIFTPQIRIILFLLITSMHAGFVLFLNVGYFPLVSIAGATLFIPSLWWQVCQKRTTDESTQRVTLYYDGDCGFCKKTCLILREFSIYRDAPIIPAQSIPEIATLFHEHHSWVVRTHKDTLLIKWEAVTYLLTRSPLFFPIGLIFKMPPMMRMGNAIYYIISKYRQWLGTLTSFLLPYRTYNAKQISHTGSLIVLILAVLTLYTNIRHIDTYKDLPYDKNIKILMDGVHLTQRWSMFRDPATYHSEWGIIKGQLQNGYIIDLINGGDPPEDHFIPEHGDGFYANGRWESVFTLYKWRKNRTNFGKSVCEIYNQDTPTPLERITVNRYRRAPLPSDSGQWPVRSKRMLEYNCKHN